MRALRCAWDASKLFPHLAIPTHSERLSDHILDDLKRLAWDINCLVETVPGEASSLGDTRHVGK